MKKTRFIFKVSAIIVLVALILSACMKSDNISSSEGYTPENELKSINHWLDSIKALNLNIDTTSTGILYIPGKVGTGPKVKAGDVVTVKYTGRFLNGTIFDASAWHYEDGKFPYLHKAPSDASKTMIQGWEEGIEVLSKGGSAAFLIPSNKGYGSTGKGSTIPPYTPLIFVIEVINIK
jgi:FKBP-type peptidyl-prolyl cis-trans isomerase FkpA